MKKYFIAGIFFLCFSQGFAQKLDSKLVSLYVLSFSKYIDWPPAVTAMEFQIGVYGNSTIEAELQKYSAGKKAAGKPVVVKQVKGQPSEMTRCNILVIAESESGNLKSILETLANFPVLVVTEKEGQAKKGAAISLFLDEDDEFKTKFELNKANIEKADLKVANDLVKLAVLVK